MLSEPLRPGRRVTWRRRGGVAADSSSSSTSKDRQLLVGLLELDVRLTTTIDDGSRPLRTMRYLHSAMRVPSQIGSLMIPRRGSMA